MTSRSEVLADARELYAGMPGLRGAFQRLRPHICPFETLVDLVPAGARVLDVGCGAGLFLGMLAARRGIALGVGFDSDADAISMARTMTHRHPRGTHLDFRVQDAGAPWPDDGFDVITMIDVMHHVPVTAHSSVIEQVAERLRPGGLWLYKDMVHAPWWMASANRMHDLVLARQWIHYLPMTRVREIATHTGMQHIHAGFERRFWYGHEFTVFRLANRG